MSLISRLRQSRLSAGRIGWRRAGGWVLTALAAVLVLVVLVAPSEVSRLTPAAFLRIPLDGLLAVAILLLLPPKARRIATPVVGLIFGALAVLKILSLGFSAILDRPFDPVLDWSFLQSGLTYLRLSNGTATATIVAIVAVLLAVAVLVAVMLSVRRLIRLVAERRRVSVLTVAVLATGWLILAPAGVQIVPNVPVAASDGYDRLHQAQVSVQTEREFTAAASVDAFRDVPGPKLLTSLRGKDVVLAFVESYGRAALDRPEIAPQIDEVLARGGERLHTAGYAARSGFLTSPTIGGGSWLAQSTLLSGLWIDNQQRYRTLVGGDRMTLNSAFRKADWRTVAVMPATVADFPEGKFFGYDQIYASKDLAYRGPLYAFAMMPDQYTLSKFQRAERASSQHAPVMATIPLISSHAPWEPVPTMIDWANVGDGSGFEAKSGAGDSADLVFHRDPARLRADYRTAIAYSLENLISYVETYGDDDLVLVFLGDHQPAPAVTGPNAGRDVPITIVARDPAVLDRISGWGWTDGLKPAPDAPVWRMDTFRDRFLTAFS